MEEFLDWSYTHDKINANNNPMAVDEWKDFVRSNSGSNPSGCREQTELVIQPFKSLFNCHHWRILPHPALLACPSFIYAMPSLLVILNT